MHQFFVKYRFSALVTIFSIGLFGYAHAQKSEALKRFEKQHGAQWSSKKPSDADGGFTFTEAEGLGYTPGVIRRDPSDIIKIGDRYHLWYTRAEGGPLRVGLAQANDTLRAFPWDLSTVWHATSLDGVHWNEIGMAVDRGKPGSFDARSVFTPNIMVDKGRYYLFYQTASGLEDSDLGDFKWTQIGMSYADSPDGPWHRVSEPVLSPGQYGDPGDYPKGPIIKKGAWDALVCHDPSLLVRDGKYYLYYKSRYFRGDDRRFSDGDLKDWVNKEGGIPIGWGVAIADNPMGPYTKSPSNPVIIGGHECIIWQYNGRVFAMVTQGPECNTVQMSKDGINFKVVAEVDPVPIAAGMYRADFSDEKNRDQLAEWGISHEINTQNYNFLERFNFNDKLLKVLRRAK